MIDEESNKELLEECKKALLLTGIKIISMRDAGTVLQFFLEFYSKNEPQQLSAVFSMMQVKDSLNIADPENGDCIREVRRIEMGFETKYGCHGAYGTWKDSNAIEALEWLLAAALFPNVSKRKVVIMFKRYR